MNLLITGAWKYAREDILSIEKLGHKVLMHQNEKDDLEIPYETVEGTVCNGLFLYHDIRKFTSLKYIQLTSAGFDRVDLNYINSHGIEIHNARGVYSVPMAEFAVCGVLQLYKQSDFFKENQKKHVWEKHRGLLELTEKNICMVGCGSVGNECAKRFGAFDCNVFGIDIKPYKNDLYKKMFSLSQLDEQIGTFDIIVLTLPLTQETNHLFDESRLSEMKQGSILVNISRGAIVETDSLINHLSQNIYGAVLDVFEQEPLSADSKLWKMENVVITPHNSFVSDGNAVRLNNVILNNLKNKRM